MFIVGLSLTEWAPLAYNTGWESEIMFVVLHLLGILKTFVCLFILLLVQFM